MVFTIHDEFIDLDNVHRALFRASEVSLSEEVVSNIQACREFLVDKVRKSGETFYGINTGFGAQYKVRIEGQHLEELQHNLILSHAAGAGRPIPKEVSRTILLLKIISLSKAHSGVRTELVERLMHFLNAGLIPVIYEFGSLGASGDLAPLAHMSLPLLGLGKFYNDTDPVDAGEVLESLGIEPLALHAKEGLALINGTQFSTAFGCWGVWEGMRLMKWANLIAATSLEAFDCNYSPFDARIQEVRLHNGQKRVAAEIMRILEDSKVKDAANKHLQDPYAFRCVPQVHGATLDVLDHVRSVIETELNAVTDNPIIFPETDRIISGGNFHAQPVALALDYLAIALSELANISERRTYQLLNGERGLPDCLVEKVGLHSGLMIAQYTAASIVNRNKMLSTPASVDSIPSSKGQEDHVSMAANAGTKLYEVLRNCRLVLGIELLCAMQALELKNYPHQTSERLRELHHQFRKGVPFITGDTVLQDKMQRAAEFLTVDPAEALGVEVLRC